MHLAVQFADGKIVAEHVYYDGTAMNAMMEDLAEAENSADMDDAEGTE